MMNQGTGADPAPCPAAAAAPPAADAVVGVADLDVAVVWVAYACGVCMEFARRRVRSIDPCAFGGGREHSQTRADAGTQWP